MYFVDYRDFKFEVMSQEVTVVIIYSTLLDQACVLTAPILQ